MASPSVNSQEILKIGKSLVAPRTRHGRDARVTTGFLGRTVGLATLLLITVLPLNAFAQRGRGPVETPGVYKDHVTAHWFAGNTRFWYRNDLAQGRREFVLVVAEQGLRQPAFDHAKLAEALTKATGKEVKADKLPVDSIEFTAEGKSVRLKGASKSWDLDLASYELKDAAGEPPAAATLTPAVEQHPSKTTGGETLITFVNQTNAEVSLFWIDTEGNRQPFGTLDAGAQKQQHTFAGHVWLATGRNDRVVGVFEAGDKAATATIEAPQAAQQARRGGGAGGGGRGQFGQGRGGFSPDGKWEAFVKENNLWLRNVQSKEETALTTEGTQLDTYHRDVYHTRAINMSYTIADPPAASPEVMWSRDSKHLVAIRTHTVPGRTVYLVESSPRDQLQPKLQSYPYLKAGDEIPVRKPHLFDVEAKKEVPVSDALFSTPWEVSEIRWAADSSRFTFLYNQRGHQVLRIVAVDANSGQATAVVDDQTKTFIDYSAKKLTEYLDDTGEVIWMSERDGWNHLYLFDYKAGQLKNQITKGDWVVRGVDLVDRQKRQIWFRAGGIIPGQDPYLVHYCRINFDGTGLTMLTDGDGFHTIEYSPDRKFILDTYSRVDAPPVVELRNTETGKLLCKLESADASEYMTTHHRYPETFVAKARDGETDIYGIIFRPTNFDPAKQYPVLENIYAGPQDAYVPKSFRATFAQQRLADRGFIVVQMDGMGTSNRSKKFHDYCFKNLGDAGFPDRIAWIKAAAAKYAYMDLSRMGIYGTSAGGQNALGGLLLHSDFYKAGVSDSGCHDNRMDKIWWNEQWMSWPVGKEYAEQSNVTLAPKLQGKLLLMVGELDKNVDPATTMQVVNALIKSNKDFELLYMPGAGHGVASTPYGRRRLEDFFVKTFLTP